MPYGKLEALEKAMQLVTAGLESGSIKLKGPQTHVVSEYSEYGKADAEYLGALLKELAAQIVQIPTV